MTIKLITEKHRAHTLISINKVHNKAKKHRSLRSLDSLSSHFLCRLRLYRKKTATRSLPLLAAFASIKESNLRSGIFIVFIPLLVGCATYEQPIPTETSTSEIVEPSFEQKAVGEALIMTNQALKSYREEYVHAIEHKVFAQSDVGAWSWKSNRTSIKHAIDNSLIDCQKNNKRHEAEYPCKIINVDGKWAGKR